MTNTSHTRQLGRLVLRLMSEMHRFDHGRTLPILHASKLTTPQLVVLEFARVPCTVSAVANHIRLSRPATSQLVDKLVRLGLVRRDLGAEDRRERHISLTSRGEALLRSVAAARAARFETSLAILPPSVAARLSKVLAEVVEILARQGVPAGRRSTASRP